MIYTHLTQQLTFGEQLKLPGRLLLHGARINDYPVVPSSVAGSPLLSFKCHAEAAWPKAAGVIMPELLTLLAERIAARYARAVITPQLLAHLCHAIAIFWI